MTRIVHYFDYKSPYAYLAKQDTYALETEYGAELEFLPYTLDIPSYLGAAELNERGEDLLEARNAHQWRRVRYSYRDCRREASRRSLTILGPRRIFDSTPAHVGMLYAKERGDFRPYHDLAFERFFLRDFDLASAEAVVSLLSEAGFDASDFPAYLAGAGRAQLDQVREEAEDSGVFGVPSYLVEGELYWGAERLERVVEHLTR